MSVDIPILCFNDVYRVSQRYVPQTGAPTDGPPSTKSTKTAQNDAGPVPGKSKDQNELGAQEQEAQSEGASVDGDDDGGAKIGVAQFAELIHTQRSTWASRPRQSRSIDQNQIKGTGEEGELSKNKREDVDWEQDKDGLVLFAGDVFNPSVESSVTRGSHMVPVINALKVDCACVGNHDFDFGFPHLTKLINATTFPWLLSNIVDKTTGKVPPPLHRLWVTERCGAKIGVIGLVEQDWIATIPSWPATFEYRPMNETAIQLSKELRDPHGPHRVDFIIALTHCRVPNDIRLANELGAVADQDVRGEHGVDLLVGGHDHIYYIGKGAKSWDGYPGQRDAAGTEADQGVRLIKSGTDFRDLTSAILTLSPPTSSTRRRTITTLKGKHHYVLPSSPSSRPMEDLLKSLLLSVSSTLSKPVCYSLTPFDARSELVRTKETGLGNWVADVLIHAYAESLMEGGNKDFIGKDSDKDNDKIGDGKGGDEEDMGMKKRDLKGGADAVIICGGTLRGDSQYGPGKITLGDILEILPFEDPVVCLEIDGKGIWDTIEGALSRWPSQEGRFPIVAGLQVQWDHTLAPNHRVKSIHLVNPKLEENDEIDSQEDMVDFVEQENGTRVEVNAPKIGLGEEVKNERGGRVYRVITREYMAQGYDGFSALRNRKFVVDDENGQIMSSIIRSFLLGSAYIWRHKQLRSSYQNHLSEHTNKVIGRARAQLSHTPASSPLASPTSTKLGLRSPTSTSPNNPLSPITSRSERDDLDTSTNSPPLSPISEQTTSTAEGGRRHVVRHDWASIRNAMLVAKHEHMSDVDALEGNEMRRQNSAFSPVSEVPPPRPRVSQVETNVSAGKGVLDGGAGIDGFRGRDAGQWKGDQPKDKAAAAHFVNEARKAELRNMGDELAIVCPLVDGRMRDRAVYG